MNRGSQDPSASPEPFQDSEGGRIIALDGLASKRRRSRRRGLVLLVLLAAGGGYASLRQSTGAAAGDAIRRGTSPVAHEASFHFGTFNIHGCVGTDGRYDASRVAKAVAELDFVGLNEVHGWAWSDASNQAADLGEELGLAWLSAPAESRWFCQQFGNGLLTRVVVDHWQRIPLPGRFAQSQRNLLRVEVRLGNQPVEIILTHLIRGDGTLRQEQFRQARQLFLALPKPAVMAGDFNADGSDPLIQELLAEAGVVDALASQRPSREAKQIDWIFVRGLDVRTAGVREGAASDHPLVWAELVLPGSGEVR